MVTFNWASWMIIHLLLFLCTAEDVTFYLNNCLGGELVLKNYHNYTGIQTEAPPPSIAVNDQVTFEYEYATKVEFGSVLDGNLNYYPSGQEPSKLFHYFFNVNETGGLFLDIDNEQSVNGPTIDSVYCSDVILNRNQYPSVIGAYFWFETNNTASKCRSETNAVSGCKYLFNCTYPNPCNASSPSIV